MKIINQIKQKPEYIFLPILVLIILLVSWKTLSQKKEIKQKQIKQEKELFLSDSLKFVLDSITISFNDSLSILDEEILPLQDKLEKSNLKRIKEDDFKRLDQLVNLSKSLIKQHQANLNLLQKEPLRSEYTPSFFSDLLEALIENIDAKQQKIDELEESVTQLRTELNMERTHKQQLMSEKNQISGDLTIAKHDLTSAKKELNKATLLTNDLLQIEYAIGTKRNLIKSKVLVKPFLKKECFIGNNTESSLFKIVNLTIDKSIYLLSDEFDEEVKFEITPSLNGATIKFKSNRLMLEITDLIEFTKTGRFVVYY